MIIEVKNISKKFKVKEKSKGFKGSLISIIKPKYKVINAVENISFKTDFIMIVRLIKLVFNSKRSKIRGEKIDSEFTNVKIVKHSYFYINII